MIAPTPTIQHSRPWAALAVLMLPVLLVSVDNTVLSFALPRITEDLQPTGNQLLWIVDIYPLVLAALLIPMGSFGDKIGRRRMLLIGSTGFTVISALVAFSPTAFPLILGRAGMGVFGAMIMPATLSLIRNIFTDPTQRRTAIAIWAAGFSGGAALGPIVGGFLLEHFYWGSVFLMAVPVMLPLLALAPRLIPESRDPNPAPVDRTSVVYIISTMGPLVFAIKRLATSGVDLVVLACIALSIVAGTSFVRRQLGRGNPMLDVRLFTRPTFTGAVLANLLSVFSLVGFLYFVSQHLQLVSGHSPMTAGLMLVPSLVITIIAGLVVVKLAQRFSAAAIVTTGLLLNAAGYLMIALTGAQGSDLGLILASVILGAGIGGAETISNDLILSAVPPEKAGAASAISETAYETGAVLGTAVLGSILNATYRSGVELPGDLPADLADSARETLGNAIRIADEIDGATGGLLAESARHAFDSGVMVTSTIGAILMVAASVMAWRTLR
ncbi:MFS transporter [Corynebacterium pacaense]|uniref:MFS transporter n=1 Tax=Corynebacterium pacaense TaxID=1816684 RepID=UPI0009B9DE05|nr:MFS transporter [Corynebacterium pacaense]